MMRRIAAYTTITAVLLGLVWLLLPPKPLAVSVLPKGTILRLEDVSYGRAGDQIPPGFPWQRLLRRFVPDSRGLGWLIPDDWEVLVFWFSNKPSDRLGVQGLERSRLRAVFFDDDGCEAPAVTKTLGYFAPFFLRSDHYLHTARLFPRHGETIGLRLLARDEQEGWEPVAEFFTRNPTPGPHPVWTPEPLPATRQVGDLEFTLSEFQAVPRRQAGFTLAEWERVERLRVEVRRAGQRDEAWGPVYIQVRDSAGNFWDGGYVTPEDTLASSGVAYIPVELWEGEPAWALTVQMARGFNAEFTSEELWTAADVRLPGTADEALPAGASSERFGALVTLENVRQHHRVAGLFYARVDIRTPQDDIHVSLVSAKDDQGRAALIGPECLAIDDSFWTELSPRDRREGTAGSTWMTLHPVAPQAGARSLELTFAIHRTHTVEFLAALTPGTENER